MNEQVTTTTTTVATVNGLSLAFPGEAGMLGRMVYRKEAMRFLGIQKKTVLRYEKKGLLNPIRNIVNKRVMYTEANVLAVLGSRMKQNKKVVLYCRSAVLGSRSNEGNSAAKRLKDQVAKMSNYCANAGIRVDEVIADIGPGTGKVALKGHDKLIELVMRKQVSLLVVESPDRLARWGMGQLLERFLAWHGVELHVACPVLTNPEFIEEIKQDLTEVIYESKKLLGEIN